MANDNRYYMQVGAIKPVFLLLGWFELVEGVLTVLG